MLSGESSANRICKEPVDAFPRPPLPTDSDSTRQETGNESRGTMSQETCNMFENLEQRKVSRKRIVAKARDADFISYLWIYPRLVAAANFLLDNNQVGFILGPISH